jgi:hypothetical protein
MLEEELHTSQVMAMARQLGLTYPGIKATHIPITIQVMRPQFNEDAQYTYGTLSANQIPS